MHDHDLVAATTGRLARAGCTAAEEEAAELVAAAPDATTLESWVGRREEGEPTAWIVGAVDFCGLKLVVEPGVYVPRPQSEELATRAAALLPPGGGAVDLCTGVGAIAAYLQRVHPRAIVIGTDRDFRAASTAKRNGVTSLVADLAGPLRGGSTFDVVTSVAPYVPTREMAFLPQDVRRYEPRGALDGGDDGLRVVRRVVGEAGRLLREGGWLLLELGGDQDVLLAPELGSTGFEELTPWWDEDGDLRGIAARRCGAGHAVLP